MSLISGLLISALGTAHALSDMTSPVSRALQSRGTLETCSNPQTSCHTSGTVNTCCVSSPGGSLLQTQFWDTNPSTGPDNSWTIHGLWPDECSGSFQEDCDSSRAYKNITAILQQFDQTDLLSYMNEFWISDDESNEDFWEHEWETHGTCISTFDPQCYNDYTPTQEVPDFFNTAVNLFKSLPTYTWLSDAGITPSNSKTYTTAAIQKALAANDGGFDVFLGCDDDVLSEVYYYFNAKGPVQNADFIPTAPSGSSSTCPSTGIQYPPK